MKPSQNKNLLKSIFHNISVLFVGFVFAFIGSLLDPLFHFTSFQSFWAILLGGWLLVIGFLIRVWATYDFYERRMKVIVLHPQKHLVTTGPYRYSRNPLYLGGNFFTFLGAALCLGSLGAVLLTLAQLLPVDFMIRREEKQLEKDFGKKFLNYKKQVRRWF